MDTPKMLIRTINLDTKPTDVWNTLTKPEQTKKIMFNCEAHSDWKVGSEIKWKGNFQGYESGEKGKILEIVQNRYLKYSSIDPNFGIEDVPENYLHVTYDLEESNSKTELTTKIENFNDDPNRIANIAKAWDNIVIPAIEKLFN
ncbi:MAG: SRPBCC family protein [bacterium]|nr:SRPBCC family protein [bacterium]